MAVRIRLAMHGIRHNRIFHMVAIDHEARRNAKPIETLAIFDPKVKLGQTQKTVQWSVDRIRYWLEKGAKPSESAIKLMTMGGILKPGQPIHKPQGSSHSSNAVSSKAS